MTALLTFLPVTFGLMLAASGWAQGDRSAAGGPLLDFATAGGGYAVTAGRFAEPASEQLKVDARGLTVLFDTAKEGRQNEWATIDVPTRIGGARDWSAGPAVLVLNGVPTGKALRNIALNLTDREGETFQFQPQNGCVDSEGNLRLAYDFAGAHSHGWGGSANGRIDKPARLSALNVHFSGPGAGRVVFARIEAPVKKATVARTVVSREEISLDTTYPGARPFHGPKALVFAVMSNATGQVTLTLSSGSSGNASQGKMNSFSTQGTNGVARYELNLPYETQYEFFKMDGAIPLGAEGVFVQTAAEAMRLDVETGNRLHLVRGESERPCLAVRNPSDQALHWTTVFQGEDVFRHRFEIPFDRMVAAGETVKVALPWPLPAKGLWRIAATVRAADGSEAEKSARFAFVDRHDVTPQLEKPKFRIGVHCHGKRYLPHQLDDVITALVATGAKLTRTDYGFLFDEVEADEGKYDWTAGDIVLDKMRAAGLSLDVITGAPPRWSWAHPGSWVSRPGLFGAFCRELAERYGLKIDYYEIGNEWDLVSPKVLPIVEALRLQREAYEGIHAACPQACVTPNGSAFVATTDHMKANPTAYNIGLAEAFADHPESYDVWALHCHGGMGGYQQAVDRQFLPMREAHALRARPWISNETALSSANGDEDNVARVVWMKPLFAWSRGARDFIWYNLRATGWFDGSEPGYGLMTPDFQPRAGYASLAALTTIFHGLDFQRILESAATRQVLAFGDGRSRRMVVAAWDSSVEANAQTLLFATDAREAEVSDHMGNRQWTTITDGIVGLPVSVDPRALILHGGTTVTILAPSVNPEAESNVRPLSADVTGREPDFNLCRPGDVHDLYAADPAHADRTWQGPADHSAKIWLGRGTRDGSIRIRAEVRDDIHAAGDALEVFVTAEDAPLRRLRLRSAAREGNIDSYAAEIPVAANRFALDIHVLEDDGAGPDGWLKLTDENVGGVRFSKE